MDYLRKKKNKPTNHKQTQQQKHTHTKTHTQKTQTHKQPPQFLFMTTFPGCQASCWESLGKCRVSLKPREIRERAHLHSPPSAEISLLLGNIRVPAVFPLPCKINITEITLLFVLIAAKNKEIAVKKKSMCFQKQFCTSSKTKACA